MNDDQLATYLREMSPAPLPSALLNRLLTTPVPATQRVVYPVIHWQFFAGPPVALAALLFLVALLDGLSSSTSPSLRPRVALQPPPAVHPPPPAGASPADYRVFLPIAQQSTLLDLSPGIVVEAGPHRPLRLREAKWLDDTTYVGLDHSTLHRRTTRTEFIVVAFNQL